MTLDSEQLSNNSDPYVPLDDIPLESASTGV
jgi:hypothetical protein